MSATDYSPTFYDAIRSGCQSSAAVVVPLILERYPDARTVVDVGCGEGWWAEEFASHDLTVVGMDGDHVRDHAPHIFWLQADLKEPFLTGPYDLTGYFDLAVCLEVAEHLPESRAASFVAELCALSPVVVFSAAIPGQPGAGHVNCQWPSWWARLFAQHGYHLDGSLRPLIWDDERVEPWYRQNLLIASATPCEPPADLVHPVIAGWLT